MVGAMFQSRQTGRPESRHQGCHSHSCFGQSPVKRTFCYVSLRLTRPPQSGVSHHPNSDHYDTPALDETDVGASSGLNSSAPHPNEVRARLVGHTIRQVLAHGVIAVTGSRFMTLSGLADAFHQASVSRSIRPTTIGASRRHVDDMGPFSRIRASEGA